MLIRAILRYLVGHPEAKDTVEGVLTCWLPHEGIEGGGLDVQDIMDGLVQQDLLNARAIGQSGRKLYWINKGRLPEVKALLGEEASPE